MLIIFYMFFPTRPTKLNIFTTNQYNFSCWYCSRNIRDDSPDANNRYDYKSEFHLEDLRFLLDKYPSIRFVSYVGIGTIMSPAAGNGNFRIDEDVFSNPYFIDMRRKFRTRRNLPGCFRYCSDAQ